MKTRAFILPQLCTLWRGGPVYLVTTGCGARGRVYRQLGHEDQSVHSSTCVYIMERWTCASVRHRVWSWGWGVHGQLGHGDPEDQLFPKCIQELSGRNIIRAAAGYCHSLVLGELVSQCVCLSVRLCVCLSACLSAQVSQSVCLSVHFSVCQPICLHC